VQAAGAELLIALTHMRQPNDELLARSVPEIDLVLGGHDHGYYAQQQQPSGNWVVKSGTDFRDLSLLKVQLGGAKDRPQVVRCERHSITLQVPEDPQTAQVRRGRGVARPVA
jgi:5'-nucleotidase